MGGVVRFGAALHDGMKGNDAATVAGKADASAAGADAAGTAHSSRTQRESLCYSLGTLFHAPYPRFKAFIKRTILITSSFII